MYSFKAAAVQRAHPLQLTAGHLHIWSGAPAVLASTWSAVGESCPLSNIPSTLGSPSSAPEIGCAWGKEKGEEGEGDRGEGGVRGEGEGEG